MCAKRKAARLLVYRGADFLRLKQAETGTPVAEVIRRMGISDQTFCRWKQKYGGLGVGEQVTLIGH